MTVCTLVDWAMSKLSVSSFMDRFLSNKTRTVVSIVSQLARLKTSEGESTRILHQGSKLVMSTSASKETLESRHFYCTDSNWIDSAVRAFDCAGVIQSISWLYRYAEEASQLINWKKQRLEQTASHVAMPLKSFFRVARNKESSEDGRKVVTCRVCRVIVQTARDCRKKEGASCKFRKQKGHIDKACQEKGYKSLIG